MELEVVEAIRKPLKEFKTVGEFEVFAVKNYEDMAKLTTHKLNKLYNIEGYKITKIKGKLCLKPKPIPPGADAPILPQLGKYVELTEFDVWVAQVKKDVENIQAKLNEIVAVINGLRE
jgi:hypothetical protein